MSLFINYWANPERPTVFNLRVARILIGALGVWKTATYPFTAIATFPEFALTADSRFAGQNFFFAVCRPSAVGLRWEQAAAVAALALFAIGWRTGLTGALAALLLAHLTGLNFLLVNERTFLPIIYFLILYALFRHEAPRPHQPQIARCRLSCMAYFLLVLSLIYFFTGWAKVKGGGGTFAWASASNIKAILQHNAITHIHETPAAMTWLLNRHALCAAVGAGTLMLELGFVWAVLLRRAVTPFFLGLAGMHAGILLTMQVNYLSDFGAIYLLFIPWDELRDRWIRRSAPLQGGGAA